MLSTSRSKLGVLPLVLALLLLVSPVTAQPTAAHVQPASPVAMSPSAHPVQVTAKLASAPVMFVENVGQLAEGARFQVQGASSILYLADDAIWLALLEPAPAEESQARASMEPKGIEPQRNAAPRKRVNLKLSFVGANPHPKLEPFDRLSTHVSYFLGDDPAKWHSSVPVWGGVRYEGLYPGIDLELTGESGRWSWRAVARDGADLSKVSLRVEGAEGVALDGAVARLTTSVGEVTLPLLEAGGVDSSLLPPGRLPRTELQGGEIVAPFTTAGAAANATSSGAAVATGAADLTYSTFLGGSGDDRGQAIAVDAAGNAYVTGYTCSIGFPTTPGAFSTTYRVCDAFVAMLSASGTALAYSTFLGGSGQVDHGYAIAVDGAGNAYVTGRTQSADFPTTPGAFDRTPNGIDDLFVVKLNPSGTGLVYSTFLGGTNIDFGYGIAVGGAGDAYVTGYTYSTDFPTAPGAFDTSFNGGKRDVFVSRLSADGSALVYSAFLGGSSDDEGYGIAVDSSGNAYVTGDTRSPDFPTTAGAYDVTYQGGTADGGDAFVAKLNPSGTGLVYSTYLGGSTTDRAQAIAVDGSGNAYVAGYTVSSDFPTTPGAYDSVINGLGDAFAAKLNPTGTGLVYSTFLGGYTTDSGQAVALDGLGNAYVTGYTWSSDFPTTAGAYDTTLNGGYDDVFVAKVSPGGTNLAYSTFLGGSSYYDEGYGVGLDGLGGVYVGGYTYSTDFPTTPGAYDTTYNGSIDAFVAKLAIGTATSSISGQVTDSGSNPVSGVTVYASGGGARIPATTDSQGTYTISGLPTAVYTITPSKSGYTFSPTSRIVTLPPNATSQDFTAVLPNNPPNVPGSPSPANNATGVPPSTSLSWTGGDPDADDTVTYQVYLDTANPPTSAVAQCSGISAATCPVGLKQANDYYWRVVATDNQGASTSGPVWHFRSNEPPYLPTAPSPADGATGVAANTDLGWTGGDPNAEDTVTYTVYLGTSDLTTTVVSGCDRISATSCDPPGDLAPDTDYYWRVNATDNYGNGVRGTLWRFRTLHAPVAQDGTSTVGHHSSNGVDIALVATDPNNYSLTYAIVSPPAHGTVALSGNVVHYTPNSPTGDYVGDDSFQWKANDGTADSNTATLTVTLTNSAPTATVTLSPRSPRVSDSITASVVSDDADGDPVGLSYVWKRNGTVVTGQSTATYSGGQAVGDTIRVEVTPSDGHLDGQGTSDEVGVIDTIVFRAASTASRTSTTLVVGKPTGVVANDVMLASISVRGAPAITPPFGWSLVRTETNGTIMRQAVYYKVATAGEPTSYTWTFSSSQAAVGGIVAYSGVDVASPVEASSGQANLSSASITAPPVTTTLRGSLIVGFFGLATRATITPPATMTGRAQVVGGTGKSALAAELSDSTELLVGPTGTRVATATVAAVSIGQLVALRPATTPPPASDTQPPTVPQGLTATAVSSTRVDLAWTPSTDNVGVVGYTIYRNGSKLATTSSPSFSDTSVSGGKTYTYTVDAFDAAGNHSAQSAPSTVTTPRRR